MRRLVNNWLYGETGHIMAGRLDSEVYGNSCSELTNMFIHRQGGISRRYPMKALAEVKPAERIIPFTIDVTNSLLLLVGTSGMQIYDFNNDTLTDLTLEGEDWNNLTVNQCKKIRSTVYYNDLYLVEEDFPLLRIRKIGDTYVASEPHVYVNQDVVPHTLQLTISYGVSSEEVVVFTFEGEDHTIAIAPNDTATDFMNSIASIEYDGWTCTVSGNVASFKPDDYSKEYREYDISSTSDTFCFYKYGGGTVSSFTYEFSRIEDTDKTGLVFGQDDFAGMKLNISGYYASDIKVISEKLWLIVNSYPSRVYISRPYGTSQILYPQDSKDTILDFVQYEVVATENEKIKDAGQLPITYQRNAVGDIVYESEVVGDQTFWIPPQETLSCFDDVNDWKENNSLTVTYVPDSTVISTLVKGSITYIERVNGEHIEGGETVTGYYYRLVSSGEQMFLDYIDESTMTLILNFKTSNGVVKATAIPAYVYDTSETASMVYTTTELSKVATSSTGIEAQLASGRGDKITWLALGSDVVVGTESSEWLIDKDMNALSYGSKHYSSFGSNNGLCVNVGTDVVFLQRGNKLRMIYTDYYGTHNLELTLTNTSILDGTIISMVATETPEPCIYMLKDDNTIVTLTLDKDNGVQAFSRWTFDGVDVVSLGIAENSSRQVLVALVESSGGYMLTYFDAEEDETFADCEISFSLTEDTTIVSGKYYYSKSGDTYAITTPTSNPHSENLYEIVAEDSEVNYTSKMTANPFDTQTQDGSITLGEAKNVSKIVFRCYNTGKLVTYYSEKDKQTTRSPICCDTNNEYIGGLADFSINVLGGTTRDLMITVESYEKDPMTLLAMAYDLRINRNGN